MRSTHVRRVMAWIVLGVVLVGLSGALIAGPLGVHAAADTAYQLSQSARGASGGLHFSRSYQLAGTSGQVTGFLPQSSPGYRLLSGFWGMTSFSPAPIVFDELSYLPMILRR